MHEPGYKKYLPYLILFPVAIFVYTLIYMFSGSFSVTADNWYNSYSLQAAGWLDGRLHLKEDIAWLETAEFEGRYYISFPPFPSVVMIPFVIIFGTDTPDHAIALGVSLLSLLYAYKLGEKLLSKRSHAVLLSLFLVLGTNYLHVSLWGAVWYIAQNMAFLLTLMAFYYAMTDNSRHSYISLFTMCAAMGCRPFNSLYLPVVLYLIFLREKKSFFPSVKKIAVYAVPAIILGLFFMWLNYARFGNVFEFGHNYLLEFREDPHGQFYTGRIADNLWTMLFSFGIFQFPQFGGFAFWVASPIVVSFVIYFIVYVIKTVVDARFPIPAAPAQAAHERYLIYAIPILVILHILAFSLHRTLGGHQYGTRYTVDTLAAVYLGTLLILRKMPPNGSIYLNIAPMLFGFVINFYGTVMYFSYYYNY